MWKCKNPNCGRTFPVPARISVEKRTSSFGIPDITRTIVEKACCPYCESIEFEEITTATGGKPL